jgi:hypothetical protein
MVELELSSLFNYGVLGLWLLWQLYREKTFMQRSAQADKQQSDILSKLDTTINKLADAIL